uniref:Uncharacterized protein n=1 Tax=Arundo donax TaxID=35708 RepID=A0A0A8Y2D1_ARUDO
MAVAYSPPFPWPPLSTSLLVDWSRLPSRGRTAQMPPFRWSGAPANAISFHGTPSLQRRPI